MRECDGTRIEACKVDRQRREYEWTLSHRRTSVELVNGLRTVVSIPLILRMSQCRWRRCFW